MSEPVIQSYVKEKWLVSTIYRQSSVMASSPPWYHETLVWEWDKETRERGDIIHQAEGLRAHFEICRRLIMGVPLEDDE